MPRNNDAVYAYIEEPNARRRMFRYNRSMWKKHGRDNLLALCIHGYYAGTPFNIMPHSELGWAARIELENPDTPYYYTLHGVQYVFIKKGENYGKCLWDGGAKTVDIVKKALRNVFGERDDMYMLGYYIQGRYYRE